MDYGVLGNIGLNVDSTNGHEAEAIMAREDLTRRMFQAREAGDEAKARRYDQAILDSDRINLAAQERESEFIAKRKELEPLPTAEERRRAHYKEVERIRKEASDDNLGNF